jgi:hypothetical protein
MIAVVKENSENHPPPSKKKMQPATKIKIQHRPVELAAKNCCLNLKPGCAPEHDAQPALIARPPKMFVSRAGRPPV